MAKSQKPSKPARPRSLRSKVRGLAAKYWPKVRRPIQSWKLWRRWRRINRWDRACLKFHRIASRRAGMRRWVEWIGWGVFLFASLHLIAMVLVMGPLLEKDSDWTDHAKQVLRLAPLTQLLIIVASTAYAYLAAYGFDRRRRALADEISRQFGNGDHHAPLPQAGNMRVDQLKGEAKAYDEFEVRIRSEFLPDPYPVGRGGSRVIRVHDYLRLLGEEADRARARAGKLAALLAAMFGASALAAFRLFAALEALGGG